MECHLLVDFGVVGLPIQHYRAERSVAESFVSEAKRWGLLRIVIDDLVSVDFPPLPCQRLFHE